jgi:hypothetical protein
MDPEAFNGGTVNTMTVTVSALSRLLYILHDLQALLLGKLCRDATVHITVTSTELLRS